MGRAFYIADDLQKMENNARVRRKVFLIGKTVCFNFFGSDIQDCTFIFLNESTIDFGKNTTHNGGILSHIHIHIIKNMNHC